MSGGRAFWYATRTVPEGRGDPPQGREQGLLDLFRSWHEPAEPLIGATDEAAILRNDVYDRPALRRWSVGRVTLLGDAAHPMTSDLGQGACQAIEDAVVLADCLARTCDVAGAPRLHVLPHPSHQPGSPRVAAGRDDRPMVQPAGVSICRFRRRCRAPVTSSGSRPSSAPG